MSANGARGGQGPERSAGLHACIDATTPHELVQMLFDGALQRISDAKTVLLEGEAARKRELITGVATLVDGLRAGLDVAGNNELAANLDALYRYMGRRLLEANLYNDAAALDEVASLLRELQSGWRAIATTVEEHARWRQET